MPDTFFDRASKEWQAEISTFSQKLAPTGVLITLSFTGDVFEVPEADWAFVRNDLQVDPDVRPTADELVQHTWLKLSEATHIFMPPLVITKDHS